MVAWSAGRAPLLLFVPLCLYGNLFSGAYARMLPKATPSRHRWDSGHTAATLR